MRAIYDYLTIIGGRSVVLASSKEAPKYGNRVALLDFVKPTPRKCTLYTTPTLGLEVGDDPIRNFDGFNYPNQKYTFEHHKMPKELLAKEYNFPVCRDTMGIRWPGYWIAHKRRRGVKTFVYVKEMEPQLVVPDLTGFDLKPYVSYAAEEIHQERFTAKVLFNAVYAEKIIDQFEKGEEVKTSVGQEEIDQARLAALQTGADLFEEFTYDGVRGRDYRDS